MAFLTQWGHYLPSFAGGLKVTLQLTGTSLLLGLPLGVFLAVLSFTPQRALRWAIIGLVELGRGIPALILLYLVYYGLPQLHLTWSSFVSATIALGFTTGAYTSEIFRAGLNAVPTGQREASRAVGLSQLQELRLVILPQAIRIVVPPVVGFSIILFQATSLAFAVSVPELLSRAYNTATITYQYMSALTFAGLLYAAISLVAVFLLRLRSGQRTEALMSTTQV